MKEIRINAGLYPCEKDGGLHPYSKSQVKILWTLAFWRNLGDATHNPSCSPFFMRLDVRLFMVEHFTIRQVMIADCFFHTLLWKIKNFCPTEDYAGELLTDGLHVFLDAEIITDYAFREEENALEELKKELKEMAKVMIERADEKGEAVFFPTELVEIDGEYYIAMPFLNYLQLYPADTKQVEIVMDE